MAGSATCTPLRAWRGRIRTGRTRPAAAARCRSREEAVARRRSLPFLATRASHTHTSPFFLVPFGPSEGRPGRFPGSRNPIRPGGSPHWSEGADVSRDAARDERARAHESRARSRNVQEDAPGRREGREDGWTRAQAKGHVTCELDPAGSQPDTAAKRHRARMGRNRRNRTASGSTRRGPPSRLPGPGDGDVAEGKTQVT